MCRLWVCDEEDRGREAGITVFLGLVDMMCKAKKQDEIIKVGLRDELYAPLKEAYKKKRTVRIVLSTGEVLIAVPESVIKLLGGVSTLIVAGADRHAW